VRQQHWSTCTWVSVGSKVIADLVAVHLSAVYRFWRHQTFARCLAAPTNELAHASTTTAVQNSQVVTHSLFWSNPHHRCTHIADEVVQFVCKLTKLQSLELHNKENVTAAGLADLHNLPALKRLGLEYLSCDISASAVPALTQLTALTCLKLSWASYIVHSEFDPSILAHMTQLEELHLRQFRPAGGAAGVAELLARLAQLTKLQVLHLAYVISLLQCPPVAFSSLTSSSVLRSLTWSDHGYVTDWLMHCTYSKAKIHVGQRVDGGLPSFSVSPLGAT